tara:strand:- start:371 stop:814 length:444 start_codon:yes stop_codon:yes gene_type:complete
VSAAAKRLCERSGWSLTNLKLQKLLYISHMFHLGKTGEPLVNGHFEAWDYGPVSPFLYHKVKVFGSSPVENIFHSTPDIGDVPEAEMLDSAIDQLANSPPGRLVAITHWDRGAWAKHYIPGEQGISIPNEDIRQEYLDRVNAVKAQK